MFLSVVDSAVRTFSPTFLLLGSGPLLLNFISEPVVFGEKALNLFHQILCYFLKLLLHRQACLLSKFPSASAPTFL